MLSRSLKTGLIRQTGAAFYQQHRTATVLRRVNQPPILGPYATKYQIDQTVFKDNKYRRYEVEISDDEEKTAETPIKIILLKSLEDYGKRGQILSIPRHLALKDLLLPGLAIYASPENLNIYKDIIIAEDSIQYSSEIVRKVLSRLSRLCVPVLMSRNHPWTLERWHIRSSMRKIGLEVNDVESVRLPDQTISGPDDNLESKEFPIWLKINDFETVPFRCVLFHWSADDEVVDECPPPGWNVRFHEPVYETDREFLKNLPREKLDPGSLAHLRDRHEITEKYEQWRSEREKKLFAS